MRPQRGSRAMSKTGASACRAPVSSIRFRIVAATAVTRSGSNAAAAPIDCWKHGAPQAMSPWRHSSWMIAGMPSRVPSTSCRWIPLAAAATSAGCRFVEPARRVMCPMPSGAIAASASASRPSSPITSNAQNEPSWAIFSARVIRTEQVAGAGREGQCRVPIGEQRRGHPFTDPAVRPPTSWRSATR